MNTGYFNYVVSFSDGTVKTGITAKPFFRLQDYIQEAHRHSVKVDGYRISQPSSKRVSLDIEKAICDKFSMAAVEGHREWFIDKKYDATIKPSSIFKCVSTHMEIEFAKIELELLAARSMHDEFSKSKNKYSKIIDFAESLGTSGERISATRATQIAAELINA